MDAMAETTTHNQVIAEIKASLNHLLYSLTNFSHATTPTQPISTLTPILSPPPLPPSKPIINRIPAPPTTALYPIMYLTYSEMKHRRDHDLCLSCDKPYTLSHRCLNQQILLILPDDGPTLQLINVSPIPNDDLQTISQHSDLDSLELLDMELFSGQKISYHALISVINLKVQLSASILKQPTAALVNSWSTRNYIHPRSSIFLSCDGYILFLIGLFECIIKMCENKVFIFDPGGKIELEFFLVARLHGYAQLNHNPGSTFSTPLPPIWYHPGHQRQSKRILLLLPDNTPNLHPQDKTQNQLKLQICIPTLRTRLIFKGGVMIRPNHSVLQSILKPTTKTGCSSTRDKVGYNKLSLLPFLYQKWSVVNEW